MSKFFVDKSQISPEGIRITGQDVTHIGRVLRLTVGDSLLLCDGEGTDYVTEIERIDNGEILCTVTEHLPCKNEPEVKITLFQGLPKQGKMEWIIKKCTEIGVTNIVPVQMERSVVKLDREQGKKKLERWQKTANEAAKQCGRGRIPQILPPIKFAELNNMDLPEFLLLPYEEERAKPIKDALCGKYETSVGIFIGPEGGFTPEEVALLTERGAHSVTLGPRILRTETAGLTAVALVLYEFNEMTC